MKCLLSFTANNGYPRFLEISVLLTNLKSQPSAEVASKECIRQKPSFDHIINEVSHALGVQNSVLTTIQKGAGRKNLPKKVAMYIAQKYRLLEIADAFGLNHYAGVSHAIHCGVAALKTDTTLANKMNSILNRLDGKSLNYLKYKISP